MIVILEDINILISFISRSLFTFFLSHLDFTTFNTQYPNVSYYTRSIINFVAVGTKIILGHITNNTDDISPPWQLHLLHQGDYSDKKKF